MKSILFGLLSGIMAVGLTMAAHAGGLTGTFASIDGGTLSVEDRRGRPVLLVNTASRCGFTDQYGGLQRLQDRYEDQGLVVLAVPSDDFRQELSSAEEVKEFCTLNYNITLPMTDITSVRGTGAHPLYKAIREETGFEPRWNFNKVLIGPDGDVLATWGSGTKPMSQQIRRNVEAALHP